MKDTVVAINRVNRNQETVLFGLDPHKAAFEPVRPAPPVPINGATNGFRSADMADGDDAAVRAALEKLSIEEQVSFRAFSPWGCSMRRQGPWSRLISRPVCSVRSVVVHAQCGLPLAPLASRFSGPGETNIIRRDVLVSHVTLDLPFRRFGLQLWKS
jgi:hypothetical protein